MDNVTVILPTKNEKDTIDNAISRLRGYNIIVVDDSDDGSTLLAYQNAICKYNVQGTTSFIVGSNCGEGPAIKLALENTKTKYCVILDCDGSHDMGRINQMLTQLYLYDYDLVVCSRYIKGGHRGTASVFSQIGNLFARRLLGIRTTDLTGRFIASKPGVLLKYCSWVGRGESCIELIYNMEKAGCRIIELPYTYTARIGGKSTGSIWRYLTTYFIKVINLKFGGMNETKVGYGNWC
jgi:glycosyltransferase involved in cell wall biosynthesis